MKIRPGFVSNSSTSSFIVMGWTLPIDDFFNTLLSLMGVNLDADVKRKFQTKHIIYKERIVDSIYSILKTKYNDMGGLRYTDSDTVDTKIFLGATIYSCLGTSEKKPITDVLIDELLEIKQKTKDKKSIMYALAQLLGEPQLVCLSDYDY